MPASLGGMFAVAYTLLNAWMVGSDKPSPSNAAL